MGLFLCQCHAIFVSVSLCYNWKSGIVTPPVLFLLCFPMNFRMILFPWRMSLDVWQDMNWNIRSQLCYSHFHDTNSDCLWTWHVFLSSSLFSFSSVFQILSLQDTSSSLSLFTHEYLIWFCSCCEWAYIWNSSYLVYFVDRKTIGFLHVEFVFYFAECVYQFYEFPCWIFGIS